MRYRYGYGQWFTQTQGQNLADAIRAIQAEKALQAELAAIAERSAHAKATNRAAIALFREIAATPDVHVGRVQGRETSGRFASDDE
jgi:N-acetylglucosamine kinase-like BadF-type ATPase